MRSTYLMTERAVSWTLEKCDSRRLKIILKCPMVCISTPALFLITCAREVRASSPCWLLSVGNMEAVTRSWCRLDTNSRRSTVKRWWRKCLKLFKF